MPVLIAGFCVNNLRQWRCGFVAWQQKAPHPSPDGVLGSNLRVAPHNGARRFGERFWHKRKYEKCGNTGCISHFSYCALGAKDPPKPAVPIVRCCLSTGWAGCARFPRRTDGWYGRRRTWRRWRCSSGTCGRSSAGRRSPRWPSAWYRYRMRSPAG